MSTRIHPKTAADFADAIEVCNGLHGEDHPFTIKLLHRTAQTRDVTKVTFKHAPLGEQAAMFPKWKNDSVEPFVMAGRATGGGLGRTNVDGTWALAVDLDYDVNMADWQDSLIKPTFAVNTSGRRYHFCWILTNVLSNVEARRFLIAIAHRLDGDPCFAHSAQAVRLPGFVNQKYGTTVSLALAPSESRCYTDSQVSLGLDVELVTACMRSSLPPLDGNLVLPKSIPQESLLVDISDALKYIESDDYELWVKVTAALHSVGSEAYNLWDEWSRSSPKYDEKIMQRKWESFGKGDSGSQVSVSSIFFLAARAGWRNPGHRYDTKNLSAESLTERTVGRMIAEKMGTEFASIRIGSRDKETYRLLEWDGHKYEDLDNSARRAHVERYLKNLIAEIGDRA